MQAGMQNGLTKELLPTMPDLTICDSLAAAVPSTGNPFFSIGRLRLPTYRADLHPAKAGSPPCLLRLPGSVPSGLATAVSPTARPQTQMGL